MTAMTHRLAVALLLSCSLLGLLQRPQQSGLSHGGGGLVLSVSAQAAQCSYNGILNPYGGTNPLCWCDDGWMRQDCSVQYDFSMKSVTWLASTPAWHGDVVKRFVWTYDSTKLYVQLRQVTTGWMGLIVGACNGAHGDGKCPGDAWVAWMYYNSPYVSDRWSQSNALPTYDSTTQDLKEATGYQVSYPYGSPTVTQISFTRLLVSPDTTNDNDILGGYTNIAYAYAGSDPIGVSNSVPQHSSTDRKKNVPIAWLQPKGPPSQPDPATLVSATTTSLLVSWRAPQWNGSGQLIGFTLQRETRANSGTFQTVFTGLPPVRSDGTYQYGITGLSEGTSYLVQVAASNDRIPTTGAFSTAVKMTTLQPAQAPPDKMAPPKFVDATTTKLTISWVAPNTHGASVTSYVAYVSCSLCATGYQIAATFSSSVLQGTITNLPGDSDISVRVLATSVAGDGKISDAVSMSTAPWPACNNGCSSHGVCAYGMCQCEPGWLKNDCSLRADFNWCGNNGAGTFCIRWTWDLTFAPALWVQLSADTTAGWLGMMIAPSPVSGTTNAHTDADVWVANVVPAAPYNQGWTTNLKDMYSTSTVTPLLDAQQDLNPGGAVAHGYRTATSTIVQFRRLLNTSDVLYDKEIINGTMRVSWAYGDGQDFVQHATTARGMTSLHFLQPRGAPVAPSPPTAFSATVESVQIEWAPPQFWGSGSPNGYAVYRETAQGSGVYMLLFRGMLTSTLASGNFRRNITGLAAGATYGFKVQASNDFAGYGLNSSVAYLSTLNPAQEPPSQPAMVTLVAATPTKLTVSWLPPATNGAPITGYRLRYKVEGSQFVNADQVNANTFRRELNAIFPANTTISIGVRAESLAGPSSFSTSLVTRTLPYPSCDNDCSGHGICAQGSCQCDLGWLTANCSLRADFAWCGSNGGEQFCVRWTYDSLSLFVQLSAKTPGWVGMMVGASPDNGMTNADTMVATVVPGPGGVGWTAAANDMYSFTTSTPVMDQQQDLKDVLGYQTSASSAADATSVVYFRRLLSTNDESSDTDIINEDMEVSWAYGAVDTPFNQHADNARGRTRINFLQPTGAPTPVDPPVLVQASTNSLLVEWGPPQYAGSGGVLTNYTLQRESAPGSGAFIVAYQGMPNPTATGSYQFSITGLSPSSSYAVRVGASNEWAGQGAFGRNVTMRTLSSTQLPPNAPGAPTLLTANPDSLVFAWTSASNNGASVTGYNLQYSSVGVSGPWIAMPSTASNVRQAVLSSLAPSTSYWIRLQATSVAGPGPWTTGVRMSTIAQPECSNMCNGHGACVNGRCQCDVGFVKADCSLQTHFSYCTPNAATLSDGVCLRWSYDASNIYFQAESYAGVGLWFGFIIDNDALNGMSNGDCFAFVPLPGVTEGTVGAALSLQDRWSTGLVAPVLDTQQDLKDGVSFVRTGAQAASLVAQFTRSLISPDTDLDKPIVDREVRVSWSIGKSAAFGLHLHTPETQGKLLINFLAAYQVGPPTAPNWSPPGTASSSSSLAPQPQTSATTSSIALQFFAPDFAGSSAITSFQLFVLSGSPTTVAYMDSPSFTSATDESKLAWATGVQVQQQQLPVAPLAYNVTGLDQGTCYSVLLRAVNLQGVSAFSEYRIMCTLCEGCVAPPAAEPGEFMLLDVTENAVATMSPKSIYPDRVHLSWTAYDETVREQIGNSTMLFVKYVLETQELPAGSSTPSDLAWVPVDALEWTGQSSSFNVTGLDANKAYAFRLQAWNTAGASGFSEALSVITSLSRCPLNAQTGTECSGRGACFNGACLCSQGFLGSDCHVQGRTMTLTTDPLFTLTYATESRDNSTASQRRLLQEGEGILYVEIGVEAGADSWAGIMIGADPIDGMSGGDAWTMTFDSAGAVQVLDKYSTGQVVPSRDPHDDLEQIYAFPLEVTGPQRRIRFQRALRTGDSEHDNPVLPGLMSVSFAVGATDTAGLRPGDPPNMQQHAAAQHGKLKIDFYSDAVALTPEITLSYFSPMPIAIAFFCLLAFSVRRSPTLRQMSVVKTVLHQPLVGTLRRKLNPFILCWPPQAATHGHRQTWLDIFTLDIRRTVTELSIGEFLMLLSYGAGIAVTLIQAATQFDAGARAFSYFWGDMTALHLALALLPVARTSIFLITCGISFERAVKWHRWVARVSIALMLGHFVTMLDRFGLPTLLHSVKTNSGEGNIFGFFAGVCMILMLLTALEPIRRQAFRIFYYTHLLLLIPIYVLACVHSRTCLYLCIGPGVLYLLDRVVRFTRSRRETEIIGLEVIDIDIPDAATSGSTGIENVGPPKLSSCIIHMQLRQEGFTFEPGQYIFLNIPQISQVAWHPFSISSSNQTPNLFSVHILSRRAGLEGLREVARAFKYGVGVGLRTGTAVVGIGQLPSSGNSAQAKQQAAANSLPDIVADANLLTQVDAAVDARGADGGRIERHSEAELGMAWEAVPLNPFSWTSDLLIRCMRYFARCSSYAGSDALTGDNIPPPPVAVRVDGPYGHVNLAMTEDYHTLVLVAGGIGITPFFSILYHLLQVTASPSCPIEHVHVVWVCSDAAIFHIVHPALWQRIVHHPKFKLHFHATRNMRPELNAQRQKGEQFDITPGRPHWRTLFHTLTFGTKDSKVFERESAERARVHSAQHQTWMANPGRSFAAASGVSRAASGHVGLESEGVSIEMGTMDSSAVSPVDPAEVEDPDRVFGSSAVDSSADQVTSMSSGPIEWPRSVHARSLGVAVFACGPAALVSDVEEQAAFHKAEFHKEVFAL